MNANTGKYFLVFSELTFIFLPQSRFVLNTLSKKSGQVKEILHLFMFYQILSIK
jgi:hypothetical protein